MRCRVQEKLNSQDASEVFTLSKWKDAVSICYDGEASGRNRFPGEGNQESEFEHVQLEMST